MSISRIQCVWILTNVGLALRLRIPVVADVSSLPSQMPLIEHQLGILYII